MKTITVTFSALLLNFEMMSSVTQNTTSICITLLVGVILNIFTGFFSQLFLLYLMYTTCLKDALVSEWMQIGLFMAAKDRINANDFEMKCSVSTYKCGNTLSRVVQDSRLNNWLPFSQRV